MLMPLSLPTLRSLLVRTALACALLAPALAPAQGTAAEASASDAGPMVSQLSNIPAPTLGAKAWMTLDATSGQVIAAQNPNEPVEPASLTKLMSAYLFFDALDAGRLSLEQKVHVSEKAWRTEGSRMFIDPNTEVSVDDLLQGVIVQSGNDATVALAEAVAGSESAFAAMMNEQAERMGLAHTHFTNSTGLPDPDHMTTVQDLATLARALVNRFPHYMHYYSQREFTYNKIRQSNRNRLLWADETVDGLKTGHTQSAGYCLVSTALRDGRRVVAVVVGSASDAARTENSLKLLNWSFKNFDTVRLLAPGQAAVQARVWEGEADTVGLGVPDALWVTVPRGRADDIQSVAQYTQPLLAPLAKGDATGTLQVSLDDVVLKTIPLQVEANVPEAGFFGRLVDKVLLLFQ